MEARIILNDLANSACDTQLESLLPNLVNDILKNEIAKRLDDVSLINFTESCKFFLFTLHSDYYSLAKFKLGQLLNYGARRNHLKIGEILLKHPDWLMKKGKMSDGFLDANNAKREFKSISVLQYAGWALDTIMLYWLFYIGRFNTCLTIKRM